MNNRRFRKRLQHYYTWYTIGFGLFLLAMAILEKEGVPRNWISYLFMFATILLYAGIGVLSRTSDVSEYYVAGRRVPALFNGMATAADWLSAASFISLAGALYLLGFDGLAYIIGWTGGFVLVAILIAPYLRKFGQYTIPDFLAARFSDCDDGQLVRILAVAATIIVSFTYVVAQIYGVGLITSRFTGIDFSVGIFVGLASILVCSFLGGMRAITWTQIAQYIILLLACLIPVLWLSVKHTGMLLPQVAYGTIVPKLAQRERQLVVDPAEQQVRAVFKRQADQYQALIDQLPQSWQQGRRAAQAQVEQRRASGASLLDIKAAERALADFPKNAEEARRYWRQAKIRKLARAAPPVAETTPFPAESRSASNVKRNNFLALVLCLMMGTAALPHVLVRYYTTPSVQETRMSVFWTLFFVMLFYVTIPALAVFVKYDIYTSLVGSSFSHLPAWVSYWAGIDKTHPLVSITDINGDGIVQLSEIVLDGDIIVLATPEIAGLPHVISGLVAAGALAAALSTADGLLLTISNALSHDVYYKLIDPHASTQKRVTISKLLLLVVALIAAYAASLKPGGILSVIGAAFSLAASILFPVLVTGIFWKRANRSGAIAGMLAGFVVCVFYMVRTLPALGGSDAAQWFGIAPASAGIFAVPVAFMAIMIVSLLTPAPGLRSRQLLDDLHAP